MKSAEFIALSACTMMLTALGIDIMLPAFSEIRTHFNLPAASNTTAQIIVFFFMGQIAQLVFGTLSDRFGRLAIFRVGFPLYIVGGIAATYAPSLHIMFAARFLAGMGASAVFTTAIAGVRDRFVGDKMASTLSLIFTIFLFTPVFAPFLGLAILSFSSWRAVFLTPPLFAMVIFVWSLRMEESLPPERRNRLNWETITQSLKLMLRNSIFLRYTLITTFLFTGLSSWVSSSEHILGKIYGKPELFAWVFASIGLVAALSALTNSRLSSKFGARRTIRGLLIVYGVVGTLLLFSTFILGDPPPLSLFFIAVALLIGLNLAVEPNSSALAMESMGDMAGMASALYGTSFFFIGAALGSFISKLLLNTVFPLVVCFFLIGIATLVLVFGDRRPNDAPSS
ncbi:MFS transporter [Olivibacter sp. CPCC 100613]|uniref:MFS transporter n=1 Tax=Olivibacter sp. CPCC 100613 TaxID=3079931 RepID=UPI002FF50130